MSESGGEGEGEKEYEEPDTDDQEQENTDNQDDEPRDSTPDTDQDDEPWDPTPDTDQDDEPWDPTPDTDQGDEPWDPIPDTDQDDEPWDPIPDTDQDDEQWEPISEEDGQDQEEQEQEDDEEEETSREEENAGKEEDINQSEEKYIPNSGSPSETVLIPPEKNEGEENEKNGEMEDTEGEDSLPEELPEEAQEREEELFVPASAPSPAEADLVGKVDEIYTNEQQENKESNHENQENSNKKEEENQEDPDQDKDETKDKDEIQLADPFQEAPSPDEAELEGKVDDIYNQEHQGQQMSDESAQEGENSTETNSNLDKTSRDTEQEQPDKNDNTKDTQELHEEENMGGGEAEEKDLDQHQIEERSLDEPIYEPEQRQKQAGGQKNESKNNEIQQQEEQQEKEEQENTPNSTQEKRKEKVILDGTSVYPNEQEMQEAREQFDREMKEARDRAYKKEKEKKEKEKVILDGTSVYPSEQELQEARERFDQEMKEARDRANQRKKEKKQEKTNIKIVVDLENVRTEEEWNINKQKQESESRQKDIDFIKKLQEKQERESKERAISEDDKKAIHIEEIEELVPISNINEDAEGRKSNTQEKKSDQKNLDKDISQQKKFEKELEKDRELIRKVNLLQKEKAEKEEKELKKKNDDIQEETHKEGSEFTEQELKDLEEQYRNETGGRPYYAGKKTKGFKQFIKEVLSQNTEKTQKDSYSREVKESKNSKTTEDEEKVEEEWERLLVKWITEISTTELSEKEKNELIRLVKKYGKLRSLYKLRMKLLHKLSRKTISSQELKELYRIIDIFAKVPHNYHKLWKKLQYFVNFYDENISWHRYKLDRVKDNFLADVVSIFKNYIIGGTAKQDVREKGDNWKQKIENSRDLNQEDKNVIMSILSKKIRAEEDIEILSKLLSKLSTDDLIEVFGIYFKDHTENYVRWGWEFSQPVRKLMLRDYLKNQNKEKHLFDAQGRDLEEGIIPKYDVLGMPEEINKKISELAHLDGQEFIQHIRHIINSYEQTIVEYILNKFESGVSKNYKGNNYWEILADYITPKVGSFGYRIYRYMQEHPDASNQDLYELFPSAHPKTVSRYRRQYINGELKLQFRRNNDNQISAGFYSLLLDIHSTTFSRWKTGKFNPRINNIFDLFNHLDEFFGDLKLKDDDQVLGSLILGTNPNLLIELAKSKIIKDHIKNVLLKGTRKRNWRNEYRKYFGRDDDIYKNIRLEILHVLDLENKENTGEQVDIMLGTESEGQNGKGLFELLLAEYDTDRERANLVELLYYLAFGSASTNYQDLVKIAKDFGIVMLITTHFEFLKMVMEEVILGDKTIGLLTINVECLEKGHPNSFFIKSLLDNAYGCKKCNNWKQEKITAAMTYDVFSDALKNNKVVSFEIYTQYLYKDIFALETIKTSGKNKYQKNWRPWRWTIDVYIGFTIMEKNDEGKLVEKTYYLGLESDGQQHQNSRKGYEFWLSLKRRTDTPENFRDWLKNQIKKDGYKDGLFEIVSNKYLIRMPTYAGQGRVENRIAFILWCFSRLTGIDLGVDYTRYNTIGEDIWLQKYEILDNLLNQKAKEEE